MECGCVYGMFQLSDDERQPLLFPARSRLHVINLARLKCPIDCGDHCHSSSYCPRTAADKLDDWIADQSAILIQDYTRHEHQALQSDVFQTKNASGRRCLSIDHCISAGEIQPS